MSVQDEFNSIASEYDANRRKFIPCFDDFYQETTSFIAANITSPRRVADLGAGTGLLSYYWMKHFPDAEYTLVDAASGMLDVAQRRFCGCGNVKYAISDYESNFPLAGFDAVISALSIHHLENDEKHHLFASIHDALPTGGIFVNYDQFCADNDKINRFVSSYWENKVIHSGLSEKDISRWRERQKLDRECSVSKEIVMLTGGALFDTAECVYSSGKFAVILAMKG